jgi:hypothetical protein
MKVGHLLGEDVGIVIGAAIATGLLFLAAEKWVVPGSAESDGSDSGEG